GVARAAPPAASPWDAAAGQYGAGSRAGASSGPEAGRARFFSRGLAAYRAGAPSDRRSRRAVAYGVIAARASQPQGDLTVERMCELLRVSRVGYYRHWQASAPREEEMALRERLQQLALSHRHYGYRRLAVLLRREGFVVNRKRVLRLMREDNLLCLRHRAFVPLTTLSAHPWPVVPNLVRHLQPTGPDQIWVADITYV